MWDWALTHNTTINGLARPSRAYQPLPASICCAACYCSCCIR